MSLVNASAIPAPIRRNQQFRVQAGAPITNLEARLRMWIPLYNIVWILTRLQTTSCCVHARRPQVASPFSRVCRPPFAACQRCTRRTSRASSSCSASSCRPATIGSAITAPSVRKRYDRRRSPLLHRPIASRSLCSRTRLPRIGWRIASSSPTRHAAFDEGSRRPYALCRRRTHRTWTFRPCWNICALCRPRRPRQRVSTRAGECAIVDNFLVAHGRGLQRSGARHVASVGVDERVARRATDCRAESRVDETPQPQLSVRGKDEM